MQVTDVVADMLTRIRNANSAKHEKVNVPCSNMKKAIADILVEEGFIKSYEVSETDNKQGMITITLKYGEGKPAPSRDCAGFPSRVCGSTPPARTSPRSETASASRSFPPRRGL